MPDALPPAAVEAGVSAMRTRLLWYETVGTLANAVEEAIAAALPALRAQWEGEVRAAYREGFEHGQDSASTFERGGGNFGCEHYWSASETLAALRAPTAPSGEVSA